MKKTMLAAVLEEYGSAFRLKAVDLAAVRPGEVRVKISASGTNPIDLKIKQGKAPYAQALVPGVIGIDLAGTIDEIGEGVKGFEVGDRVYGMAAGAGGRPGSLAEYASVDARLLARIPSGLSFRESAAIPLVFITAWEGLIERARIQPGMKVLVHGGAGGVGHMAVQLALSEGAKVFATGSDSSQDTIRAVGAQPIDYRKSKPEEYVAEYTDSKGFDIVFDTVGGETLDSSFASVRRSTGHVVSAVGWGSHSLAPLSFRGASYSGIFTLLPLLTGEGTERHGEILRAATRLIEAGKLKPSLDSRRFDLTSANEAYDYFQSGLARGKVIVEIP